jgi:hypothetical protein
MILFFLAQNPAHAIGECSTPFANVMLRNRLSAANEALEAGDLQSMHNQLESINLSISCLIQPLNRMLSVKYHMLMGTENWLNQQTDAASNHFAAVKHLHPTSEIPAMWLPEDERLRVFYDEITPSEEFKSHEPPENAMYYFDGQANNEQPLYRPSLYQYVVDDRALQTVLLSPGELLPEAPAPQEKPEAASILSSEETGEEGAEGVDGVVEGEEVSVDPLSPEALAPTNIRPSLLAPTISGVPFSNNIYITSGMVFGAMSLSRAAMAMAATKRYNDNLLVESNTQLELLNEIKDLRQQSVRRSSLYALTGIGLSTYGVLQWEW